MFILTSYFKNTSKIEKHVEKIVKELTKLEIENCWTTRENAEHRIKPRYVRLIFGSFYEVKFIKSEKATKFCEIISTVDLTVTLNLFL